MLPCHRMSQSPQITREIPQIRQSYLDWLENLKSTRSKLATQVMITSLSQLPIVIRDSQEFGLNHRYDLI